ncbi:MAG TPA: FKBP-type peptidyl-prolyl cis-trans isomerase [Vicinamibacterales bacterium]|nr:FKBP-type peptidyl-prolyl cis-trans isomerase [Vicinamibacterales bacterium]
MTRPSMRATAVFILMMTACTDTPVSPTTSAAYRQMDIVLGTGVTANSGASVTVDYTGWLYDASKPDQQGLQFDSSIGKTPFSFTLGAGEVIKGWELGVPGMLVGGERRLVIPPSLAYGDTRSGIIPPNATLVFDITLLNVS